jgi:PPM family protein phosphatase
MLALEIAIISEQGGRAYNEDACGHWQSEHQFCAALADGAGGHGGGDVASRLAVQNLLAGFSAFPSGSGIELARLVRQSNQAVLDARVDGTNLQDMHTTLVCVVVDVDDGRADWAHAGDSRLYWFRDGRLMERTRDHSLVASLVDVGMISEEETRSHPKRSVLLSALGNEDEELEVGSTPSSRIVSGGDVMLMCSDGVWEYVEDATFESTLSAAASPQEWLGLIEAHIKEATKSLASHDNYTAIAVWLSGSTTS